MIDLHSHTTASDGEYPPAAQVALAAKAGLTTLAVTDHDTLAGLAEAKAACAQHGLDFIPGIEVSCRLNRREVHILGHFVDVQHSELLDYAARLAGERETRMKAMVHKLNALGVPVTMEHVLALANGAALTRPHLALALVELRICTSVKEAFSRFLGDGRPAWVPKFELSAADGIALIHRARGTATLAHPGSSKVNRLEVEGLAGAGLDGLEVVHLDHPPRQREVFSAWAADFSLCRTAGSDFHGPHVAPDRRFGDVSMDSTELTRLRALLP